MHDLMRSETYFEYVDKPKTENGILKNEIITLNGLISLVYVVVIKINDVVAEPSGSVGLVKKIKEVLSPERKNKNSRTLKLYALNSQLRQKEALRAYKTSLTALVTIFLDWGSFVVRYVNSILVFR